ncbi:MAG: bifunctional UDP-N-acetylmuramoyl-tripeptide:D-alanyl-D-alanine ligase/alanine racemase, partial [Prevotella sp.]|nr:bifunctional UDP-N-acetylmuramoyl-tripeptide:D-alanyl-D-alanine ligase/alanine racemase [Prevotella sp.]
MKASEIKETIHATFARVPAPDAEVEHLLTDSRSLADVRGTLFFAIPTQRNSGCRYVDDLYRAGVRQFVIPDGSNFDYPDANVWKVADVVAALQLLAASHRS